MGSRLLYHCISDPPNTGKDQYRSCRSKEEGDECITKYRIWRIIGIRKITEDIEHDINSPHGEHTAEGHAEHELPFPDLEGPLLVNSAQF